MIKSSDDFQGKHKIRMLINQSLLVQSFASNFANVYDDKTRPDGK